MKIELCDRCCKSINTFSRYEFLIPTELEDTGKVYNNKTVVLCNECSKKFLQNMHNFVNGNTKERIENIQSLNVF